MISNTRVYIANIALNKQDKIQRYIVVEISTNESLIYTIIDKNGYMININNKYDVAYFESCYDEGCFMINL